MATEISLNEALVYRVDSFGEEIHGTTSNKLGNWPDANTLHICFTVHRIWDGHGLIETHLTEWYHLRKIICVCHDRGRILAGQIIHVSVHQPFVVKQSSSRLCYTDVWPSTQRPDRLGFSPIKGNNAEQLLWFMSHHLFLEYLLIPRLTWNSK